MRIDANRNSVPVESLRTNADAGKSSAKAEGTVAAGEGDATLSRSTELNRYVLALKGMSDVREDVMANVAAQVQAGNYTNAANLAQAATSIVDDGQ